MLMIMSRAYYIDFDMKMRFDTYSVAFSLQLYLRSSDLPNLSINARSMEDLV
jgi:hypothetical protein